MSESEITVRFGFVTVSQFSPAAIMDRAGLLVILLPDYIFTRILRYLITEQLMQLMERFLKPQIMAFPG
jgi:hypothetical protein